MLLVQGSVDDTVPPAVTADYLKTLCQAGSHVTMQILIGVGHLDTAKTGAPDFSDWLSSLHAGKPVPNNCP